MHVYAYARVCLHGYIYMYLHVCIYDVGISMHMYIYLSTCIYMSVHMHIGVCVWMCVLPCVYICVHMSTHLCAHTCACTHMCVVLGGCPLVTFLPELSGSSCIAVGAIALQCPGPRPWRAPLSGDDFVFSVLPGGDLVPRPALLIGQSCGSSSPGMCRGNSGCGAG